MKRKLMDYLCCPVCKTDLQLDVTAAEEFEGREEITEGELSCTTCSANFPVRGGIPRFISGDLSRFTNLHTGAKFAEAWREFPRFDESYRSQFFDWIAPVDEPFLQNKLVLEGGCGKGRHARIIAESRAKEIVSVDIGDAIEIAYNMIGRHEKVHLVQADLTVLPLKPAFDFAFSVGVLHHIDDPSEGFVELSSKLKPDGSICAWVYGRENNGWLVHFVNPIRIAITSKLPPSLLRVVAFMLALPVFIYSQMIAKPWSTVTKRFRWLPKLFYQDYLSYIARFDFNEIHHIVYDHLAAPVANYVTRENMKSWFRKAQFNDLTMRWHNRNSWTGCASQLPEVMERLRANMAAKSQPDFHQVPDNVNPVKQIG